MTLTTLGPDHHGQALSITGPIALSTAQMVAKIGAAASKPADVKHISLDEERRRWVQRGELPESVDYHLSIFTAIRDGRLADTTDTVAHVLGRPPILFDQWAIQNADAFRVPRHPAMVPARPSTASR